MVYGTLAMSSAHPMAARLRKQARWLGRAQVHGTIHQLAAYPGLVLDPQATPVTGDLFELTDPDASFIWLDAYEGCGAQDAEPHEYQRLTTQVLTESGTTTPAWIYVYAWPLKCTPINPLR